MKAILFSFFVISVLACSKKAGEKFNTQTVIGTVIQGSDHSAGAVLVEIENPTPDYSFICYNQVPIPSGPGYNCFNAVYIVDLDVSLRNPGTKITFSKWKDLGRALLWSSTYAANDLKVFDARKL